METIWIPDRQREAALRRNQAYWDRTLEGYPLLWVTAPDALPGRDLPEPADEASMWTDIEYAMNAAEVRLSRVHYAGDALPFYDPWFGPDQFAAWLGAEMRIRPRESTSWINPLIDAWDAMPELRIDPDNRWWKLYLASLDASIAAGAGKWITCFPDLHSGIDALSALRGPENLSMDLLMDPEPILSAMNQLTALWKWVVDLVYARLEAGGQGTSNWTGGWSSGRFVCIGQNDFTCMISPEMFDTFCYEDTRACIDHVDHALYHLDGPGATRHLPRLLTIEKLHTVQWVYGDGNPTPRHWLEMLRDIQARGKSVQIWYNLRQTRERIDIWDELDAVCPALDPAKLFIGVDMATPEGADAVVRHVRGIYDGLRARVG